VVKIAADGFADPGCEVRFMLSHRQVARHLEATGLPATYLAPALYMEDLLAAAGTIRESAEVAVPGGHGRVGFVAASDVVSAVFAREVGYTDQPPERARELMLASGLSRWQADGNLELFDWIRQGGADTVTPAVREVTGADPRPMQEWLEESRGSFEGPPLDLPRSFF